MSQENGAVDADRDGVRCAAIGGGPYLSNTPARTPDGFLEHEGSAGDAAVGRLVARPAHDAYGVRPCARSSNVLAAGILAPSVLVGWNSALPHSLNEGAFRGARGLGGRIAAGGVFSLGNLEASIAPVFTYHQNRHFEFPTMVQVGRSLYYVPWRGGTQSADLPERFGAHPIWAISPGQSYLAVGLGPVRLGASTENRWWGPAARNPLVLGSAAEGFPHFFVEIADGVAVGPATIHAIVLLGSLRTSPFFNGSHEGERSISAFSVYGESPEGGLTVGVSRAVYGPSPNPLADLSNVAHAFRRLDDLPEPREGIVSLWARGLFPESGFQLYGEVGWTPRFPGLRDLFAAHEEGFGFTAGLEWVGVVARGVSLQLRGEVTTLEQDGVKIEDPTPSFYVSDRVQEGYTHRGQLIGAPIGPGASSQWIAADVLWAATRIGLDLQRIRWDNDAYYSQPTGGLYFAHDVSVLVGLRAGRAATFGDLRLWLGRELRLNYRFQNPARFWGGDEAVDIGNLIFRFDFTPGRR